MIQPPFPYNRSPTASRYISDHKNCSQEKSAKRRSEGFACLDKPVLAQGVGWGVRCEPWGVCPTYVGVMTRITCIIQGRPMPHRLYTIFFK